MPSNWTKQPQFPLAKYLNDVDDSQQGGRLTSMPASLFVSQGAQNIPGDRFVLGVSDALALSDTTVGTLYAGMYMYVLTASGSVGSPARARLCFWDTSVGDATYQVTPDESGAQGANLIAGVFINAITKGDLGYIQILGKASIHFKTVLTGIPSDGCAVYAAGVGAGADLGTVDVLDGAGNPTFTQVGSMLNLYMGVAEGIPVANTTSLVDLSPKFYRL